MRSKKVLIANRSEIACRVIQSCREMGLKTVGIFAPGDEESRHMTYSDEVHSVPSYLDIDSIVKIACQAGADLVHPGYGFLSERPAFCRAVEKAGLNFVGPRPETMEALGEKIAAKQWADQHKIPTLPWVKVARGEDIGKVAQKIGFPLLLKASAGGGGKGMRRVEKKEDLAAAAESASSEALNAFGDGTLFMERALDEPRHIEVQVFGDGKGQCIHLYERECSLQRRHQKIWEEASAPHLKKATREKIQQAALRLAESMEYRSAGTVEFLVDSEENFYFLEMNTRLQVEHPVTELVTGIDLVWAQLAQAQSEEAIFKESPSLRGHAIEVRICAEDPMQGFVPTPGFIQKLKWPTGPGVRIDSGIEDGQQIGSNFDSMLAKLIVYAQNRDHALARLRVALEDLVILGVGTNQNYLSALAHHPAVLEGRVHTGFLAQELGNFQSVPSEVELSILSVANTRGFKKSSSSQNPLRFPSPWFYKEGR